MKKIVIIIGAYCYNRGSEALVKGTIAIIKKFIPDSYITVSSAEDEFSPQLQIKGVDEYVKRCSYGEKMTINRIICIILRRVLKANKTAEKIKYKHLLEAAKDADVILVVGADNYAKSYNGFDFMSSLNKLLRETAKGKMVMYDCSLDPVEISDKIKTDFDFFDVITARELITYNGFKNAFPAKEIYYFPDPAFVMEKKTVPLPEGFVEGKMVGVNVSSLVVSEQYGSNQNKIINAYVKLIQFILSKSGYHVILIPHVMKRQDLKTLEVLYDYFKNDERVMLVSNENYNAEELKYIISKCEFFIGARTHSTIAAYSSQVPTLVLGYSVKSIGIARDIFGTENGYVVSTKDLETEDDLVLAFENILQHEDDFREHLKSFMPGYIEKAWSSGELFAQMV